MSVILDILKALFGGNASPYNPARDIPSLAGKVILITGANSGIGKQTATELSKHNPAQVWIGARNVQAGNDAVSEIKAVASPGTIVKFLQMDLASLNSVKIAARTFAEEAERLDVLMLNAGMMGGQPGVTEDGYERQFATNFLGHALLLKLLTPQLLLSAKNPTDGTEPRVVMLSSDGHKASQLPKNKIDFATMKSAQLHYNGITKYCQSKLADAVYAAPVAKRYPQFTTVSINPGEVSTGLFNKGTDGGGWIVYLLAKVVAPLLTKPVEEGCKNSLWSATSKDAKNGKYYDPVGKLSQESQVVKDGKLGEELWEWTQRELSDYTL